MRKHLYSLVLGIFAVSCLSVMNASAEEVGLPVGVITPKTVQSLSAKLPRSATPLPGVIAYESGTHIQDCTGFKNIRNDMTGDYTIVNDINCSNQNLLPMGLDTPFDGTINNWKGYKISGGILQFSTTLYTNILNCSRHADMDPMILENFKFTIKFNESKTTATSVQDYYGAAIAASPTTLMVGAPLDGDYGVNAGAIYVYQKSGNTWVKKDKITALAPSVNNYFGANIDLLGNVMVVARGNYASTHGVYVFRKIGTQWKQDTEIPVANNYQAVLDGYNNLAVRTLNGVEVYRYDGTNWNLLKKLSIPDSISSTNFDYATSIAFRSGLLVVGCPAKATASTASKGKVIVYRLIGNTWSDPVIVEGSTPLFGQSVSLIHGRTKWTVAVSDLSTVSNFDYPAKNIQINTLEKAQSVTGVVTNFGATIKAHDDIIMFSSYPIAAGLNNPLSEKVIVYKCMDDLKWYKIGEFSPSDYKPTKDKTALHTSGFGRVFEFNGPDVFVGAYFGDYKSTTKPNVGTLYTYSAKDIVKN